jgi:hypothetical protein
MAEHLILLPAGESFRGVVAAVVIAAGAGLLAWFLRRRMGGRHG